MKRRTLLASFMSSRSLQTATGGLITGVGLRPMPTHAAAPIKVGMFVPLSGPASLFGPSSKNCSSMAADEINARGGLAGRMVQLEFADAGVTPEQAKSSALALWKRNGVEAFIGMHDSSVRGALVSAFQGQVPYIYTPPYEGGECSKGTYVLGETPIQQLQPTIPWLARQRALRRWYLIGNDYNWPRDTNAAAKQYIVESGGQVVGEEYTPFSTENFSSNLSKITASGADAVLITLVGGASVNFNRQFAAAKLDKSMTRLGTLIEENTLAGIGAANSASLFSSSGYFSSLQTRPAKAFANRYIQRFGDAAPLNLLAQSCYEGLLLLEAMAERAKSLNPSRLEEVAQWLVFNGPRGNTVLHNRHAIRDIYVAQAEGTAFRVVKTFEAVRSGQGCKVLT
jgi:urea transport system substrate-binding protein